MKDKNTEPTLVEVRKFIFKQMKKLESKEISIHEAATQAKLAHQIMDGYKTQVRLLEVVGLDTLTPKEVIDITHAIDNKNV